MERERKLLFISSFFMLIYLLGNVFIEKSNLLNNKLDLYLTIIGGIGVIEFFVLAYSKKIKLENHKLSLIIFSILFFLINIVSGILGFMSINIIGNKTKKRPLPELKIEHYYKDYVYIITFLLCMFIIFFLHNYMDNKLDILSKLFMILLNVFIFRKDIIRDLKYFKEYFKEYNSLVLRTYLKSLAVIFILSLSIRLYTGISNATNQETIVDMLKGRTLYTSILTIIYAPIIEEILFRGYFRKIINNKYLFILLSGFIFGILHVIDDYKTISELLYIFTYGSLGCFLAYIYYKTNNICCNIYFHFLQNFISVVLLLLINNFYMGI